MSKLNRIVYPISIIFLMGVGNVWAEQAMHEDMPTIDKDSPSNIEAWEEEEESTWTWFGMGFEARRSSANSGVNAVSSTGSMDKAKTGRQR